MNGNKAIAVGALIVGIAIGLNWVRIKKLANPYFAKVQKKTGEASKNITKFFVKQQKKVKNAVGEAKHKVENIVAEAEKEIVAEQKAAA